MPPPVEQGNTIVPTLHLPWICDLPLEEFAQKTSERHKRSDSHSIADPIMLVRFQFHPAADRDYWAACI